MKRRRFREERVMAVLKENETDDLCQRHGISSATFYA